MAASADFLASGAAVAEAAAVEGVEEAGGALGDAAAEAEGAAGGELPPLAVAEAAAEGTNSLALARLKPSFLGGGAGADPPPSH